MPIHLGKDSKGPFVQWGHRTKYHYKANNKASLNRAKAKAKKQMKAIFASGYISEDNNTIYYRVTYNNIGIYQALKNNISFNTWKSLLQTQNFNWLPKPPKYLSSYQSYFTELGFIYFKKYTLPICKQYLNEDFIKIEKFTNISNIIYNDDYQIVIDNQQPTFNKIYNNILMLEQIN